MIKFRRVAVQKQDGGQDCGLFAIAFAFTLANGLQPHNLSFAQSKMRPHLAQCLKRGYFTDFPITRTNRTKEKFEVYEFKVVCYCRSIENGKMIKCYNCKEWFHSDCVGLDVAEKKWLCKYTCAC